MKKLAADAVSLWFSTLVGFVAKMDDTVVRDLWRIMNAATEPVLSGRAWSAEFQTMAVIAASVMAPLLFVAVILAVIRQDPAGLVRTVLVRVPLALLLTGIAVEIVSLALTATDQACAALIHSSGVPLHRLFTRILAFLAAAGPSGLAVNFLCLVLAGFLAFLVFLELVVRSAAVAAATLFLPLALAGSALPATSHWPRRLTETLAALVCSKLVIVAVLTLAVGTFADANGLAALVEGMALFGLSAAAPFALARLMPVVEAGAASHLEGLGRQSLRSGVATTMSVASLITTGGASEAAPSGTPDALATGGTSRSGGDMGLRHEAARDSMGPPDPASPSDGGAG